jgi:betaine lipid synthase
MASPGGNISPPESNIISPQIFVAGLAGVLFFTLGLCQLSSKPPQDGGGDGSEQPSLVKSFLLFCYSCFLKPHSSGAKGGQQDALESFYAGQAGAVRLYCPRGIEPTQLTSTSTM